MQRSPRFRICETRSEIRTALPDPVVPETMVCWVSARLGQGIPAMRQEARRALGKKASARQRERGWTRLLSSRAVAISAPRTRLARSRRLPQTWNRTAHRAMPPIPIHRPSQAFE